MLQHYTVTLTRDIVASSAHAAAQEVLTEVRTATDTGIFEVENEDGETVMTSTGDDEPEYENCACVGVQHDATCTNVEGR